MTRENYNEHIYKFLSAITELPDKLGNWNILRIFIFLIVDTLVTYFSYWLAYYLRLDTSLFGQYRPVFLKTLPILVVCCLLAFWFGGLYRQLLRFANASTARLIVVSTLIATIIANLGIRVLFSRPYPPRSVPLIFFLIFCLLSGTLRFSWKILSSYKASLVKSEKEKCIIYGAGAGGELFARHFLSNPYFRYDPVGFVDDDPNKTGRTIHGLKILGGGDSLASICGKLDVKTVVLAIPSAPGKTIRNIYDSCYKADLNPLVMPDIANVLNNSIVQPRSINIADLLKRSPASINHQKIRSFIQGKKVLVSGAGGSIGSEICRQIAELNPELMILLDFSEYNLYRINMELEDRFSGKAPVVPVLGSTKNKKLIDEIFSTYKPDCVLHAAAYKHVPIVEKNPVSGIRNNILGTRILSEASLKHGTKNFILVSTDKAVRPANLMGASKRCCEILIQSMFYLNKDKCKFSVVRFGNVLGSSGSVVPRFMEQIKNGGPVTVTHPDITRYFMLTSEAVSLVLQAAASSVGGEIFVLNMGEPVRIFDMACNLIMLAGKKPGVDIEIIFTGLRPGEKLYEELILEGTEQSSLHNDIFILKTIVSDPLEKIKHIDEILRVSGENDLTKTVNLVRDIAFEA